MCTSLAGDLYAVNGRESMVEVAPVRLETLRGGGDPGGYVRSRAADGGAIAFSVGNRGAGCFRDQRTPSTGRRPFGSSP